MQTAAVLLHAKYIGAMPVLDDANRLVGIFGERDIVRAFATRCLKVEQTRVVELMTKNVVTCAPDTKVLEAMALMKRNRIRHLPMLDGGRPSASSRSATRSTYCASALRRKQY